MHVRLWNEIIILHLGCSQVIKFLWTHSGHWTVVIIWWRSREILLPDLPRLAHRCQMTHYPAHESFLYRHNRVLWSRRPHTWHFSFSGAWPRKIVCFGGVVCVWNRSCLVKWNAPSFDHSLLALMLASLVAATSNNLTNVVDAADASSSSNRFWILPESIPTTNTSRTTIASSGPKPHFEASWRTRAPHWYALSSWFLRAR